MPLENPRKSHPPSALGCVGTFIPPAPTGQEGQCTLQEERASRLRASCLPKRAGSAAAEKRENPKATKMRRQSDRRGGKKKEIVCAGLGGPDLGGKEQRVPVCQSPRGQAGRAQGALRILPGRGAGGGSLHCPLGTAEHRPPASLSCASSPHPAPAIQPQLGPAVPAAIPRSPASTGALESGERQGAAFAFAGTPPSGQRGKGERGHAQVLGSSQRCRLSCLTKVLEAF